MIAVAGLWLIVRGLGKVCSTTQSRGFVAACGLLLILSGGWVGIEFSGADAKTSGMGEVVETGIPWVYYTPERLAEEQAAGRVSVIDFTAEAESETMHVGTSNLIAHKTAALMAYNSAMCEDKARPRNRNLI